jgi:TrmH RNA methyltransferase
MERRKNDTKELLSYYGAHACLLIFERRKHAIEKVFIKEERIPDFAHLLKWCADRKKPYKIVQDEDLKKLTDSLHHEGICIQAKPHEKMDENTFLTEIAQSKKDLVLFLNHVENPHNLGAIVRNCAHFNIRYLLVDTPINYSPACVRIAQGGCETTTLVYVQNTTKVLKELKKLSFEIVATSSHEGSFLHRTQFQSKTCLILGSEGTGIDPKLNQYFDKTVEISGSGNVESLNVSHAAALFCYAYFCQHGIS